MNKTELANQITNGIGKTTILRLTETLDKTDLELDDLVAITFHADKDVAFRATWLLENVFLQHPEKYIDKLEHLLSVIPKVKHPGPQRHYAKIVMHITEPHAPQILHDKVQQLDMEPVVEQLFEWMIAPKVKIAVKAFAAEALFNMKDRYLWIKDELAQQLQFLMRDGTAAIHAKGKKLLHQLR